MNMLTKLRVGPDSLNIYKIALSEADYDYYRIERLFKVKRYEKIKSNSQNWLEKMVFGSTYFDNKKVSEDVGYMLDVTIYDDGQYKVLKSHHYYNIKEIYDFANDLHAMGTDEIILYVNHDKIKSVNCVKGSKNVKR